MRRFFLQTQIPETLHPGLIVDIEGKTIGKHDGLAYYTIGQRKGIRISSPHPLYVIEKRLEDNILVVGPAEELGFSGLITGDNNWINDKPRDTIFRTQVKTRYKAAKAWATIEQTLGNELRMIFDEPQRDLTAGQLAVLYLDEVCLGSGIIKEVFI